MRWQDKLRLEKEITFPGRQLVLIDTLGLLYWEFTSPCSRTGERQVWQSRTWAIKGMDEDAIVKTAFAALKLAVEHEVMEFFKYKGVAIFDPHTPINALMEAQGA